MSRENVPVVYLSTLGFMTGLMLLLATLLLFAYRRLHVAEDPRIDAVEEMLPHANCGACGLPGCRAFAEAVVRGDKLPADCTVSDQDGRARIAAFLGVDVGAAAKRVARLACAGGDNVATTRAVYVGVSTCRAAAQVGGGGKACAWGCLGFGDCADSCDFGAISMNPHRLPVVDEAACTACGDCVVACPKDLFSIHPVNHQLWVACRNRETGDQVLSECQVACTACGRCAMDASPGLITMQNNLPVVHYDDGEQASSAVQRCPTGAIAWIEADGHVVYGVQSPGVLRQEPRHSLPT